MTPPLPPSHRPLPSLQAGRALAAMAVAAFHLSITMGEARYGGVQVLRDLTAHGNLGVDFFFVLSGFIILNAHHADIDRPQALGRYAWRRFSRLFPVYWIYIGTFTVAVLLGFGGGTSPLPHTWPEVLTGVTLIRFADRILPFPVAWSLVHELLFYVLFGLLIVRRTLGIAACFLVAGLALAFFHYTGEGNPDPWQVYTSSCNLYFFAGMAAWVMSCRAGSAWHQLAIGMALFVAAAAMIAAGYRHGPLLLVAAFMVLVGAIAKLDADGRVRVPRALVFVGDASYSIYLLHLPAASVLLKAAMKLGLPGHVGAQATWVLVFAGMVVLPCIAYVLVERPLLKLLRHPPAWLAPRSVVRGASAT